MIAFKSGFERGFGPQFALASDAAGVGVATGASLGPIAGKAGFIFGICGTKGGAIFGGIGGGASLGTIVGEANAASAAVGETSGAWACPWERANKKIAINVTQAATAYRVKFVNVANVDLKIFGLWSGVCISEAHEKTLLFWSVSFRFVTCQQFQCNGENQFFPLGVFFCRWMQPIFRDQCWIAAHLFA